MQCAWLLLLVGCGFHAQPIEDPNAQLGDAPLAFDAATCPATYTTTLPGYTATSRYRLIATGALATVQSNLCNADMLGATHLIVLSSMDEVLAVSALVEASGVASLVLAHNAVWVGGVQQRSATLRDQNWLGFDDQPLISAWSPGEPNDGGASETDHAEQYAWIQKDHRYLSDTSNKTSNSASAICECDGNPVGPLATAAISENP